MTQKSWIFLLLVIGTGCAVTNLEYFSTVQPANDPSYGYEAENPITIKKGDLGQSIDASYYYLSRLRSGNGNRLQLIGRGSTANPNYEKPAVPLTNRFTGEPLSYGTGPLLDRYVLVPEEESDTIVLYINPYQKGPVKIPDGLKFETE